MSTTKRPTTPLRRVSRGSLSALSHSRGAGSSTHLSFLEGAMGDLADETSVLQSNLEQLDSIHGALATFNESFAMYLYGLKMNAFCVEWPEAPAEENFERARERSAQQAEIQARHQQLYLGYGGGVGGSIGDETMLYPVGGSNENVAARLLGGGGGGGGQQGSSNSFNPADQTYVTLDEDQSALMDQRIPAPNASALPSKGGVLKPALKKPSGGGGAPSSSSTSSRNPAATSGPPKGGARITLAQKKKREAYAATVIDTLPLEYRGNDPKARQLAQGVIMALIASGRKGARINEIVKPPDMTQAKVNKTLIALVAAKQVIKVSNNGIVYQLDPSRHPDLP
ncbi:hypothetical protein IE53DRAFT_384014 [Violaceomyces palustris]|uniref:Uncharacterized protein n=1 Tax=Violaceomyces palustris TaxID=1673888 RepID=A0ACD0P617_9BASI|nr:hypothetical protein IE53DRAFT_384014 [Violaceomyces palustris]